MIQNLPIYGESGAMKNECRERRKKPELIARPWVSSGTTVNGRMTERSRLWLGDVQPVCICAAVLQGIQGQWHLIIPHYLCLASLS